jgi:hypothetical protein
VTGIRSLIGRVGLGHLADLSDGRGIYEHALLSVPRRDHGYCLDDVARALVVVIRERRPSPVLRQLAETYLRFVEEAVGADGSAHNRMSADGEWTDSPSMGDWWGRAVGALGYAAGHAPGLGQRVRASRVFLRASRQRPAEVRTAAFAVLGAADLLRVRPGSAAARGVLRTGLDVLPQHAVDGWNWPEPRLRYANASLAEALLAAGAATGDEALVSRALGFLGFLLHSETRDGHLSVTGVTGRSPGETGPFFDQQGIEVAAIADACARAFRLTGDPRWYDGVRMAWAWFEGVNDVGLPMVDPGSGAGYDGLEAGGRNENRGAESTLAALGTFQRARELGITGATP